MDQRVQYGKRLIYHTLLTVQTIIGEEEKVGISRERIIVGGFSQGGAVALYSALAVAQAPLGGILGLSTWLPLHKSFPQVMSYLLVAR